MKPTLKISIGGLAFTLEEDAYVVLKNYLDTLRNHFNNNPEANEIITDIESRMSELLMLRLDNKDRVVSLQDAQQITQIMGNPKDFGYEETSTSATAQSAADSNSSDPLIKKKLFRDTEHGLLGGVCSGLANYLRIDPVIVRLGLVLLLILLKLISFKAMFLAALFYFVLTVIIPKAKTFEDRMAMKGTNPSIADVEEKRYASATPQYRGSALGLILITCLKVLLGITAVSLIISVVATVVAMVWFYVDTDVLYVRNYLFLVGKDGLDMMIATLLLSILPMIAMIVPILKLVFNSKFTSRTLVSFLVGFFVWIGTIFYIGFEGFGFGTAFKNKESKRDTTVVETKSDTLYVTLGSDYINVEEQPGNEWMYYKGASMKDRAIFLMPEVRIEEDTTATNFVLNINKDVFGKSKTKAKKRFV